MTISRDELRTLTAISRKPCASLFMPTVQAGAGTRQNPIRFRNLLRLAETELKAKGYRRTDAEALLEPVREWPEDNTFWQQQGSGLAVFLAPGAVFRYRVPLELDELVMVGDRFHLKPLIPLLNEDGRFFILTLSQHSVRLFEASRESMRQMPLEDVPTSLEEALKYDVHERSVQYHATTRGGQRGREPIFHGQGGTPDEEKTKNLLRFFHQVHAGVTAALREERGPLVLACVEYLFPIYQQVNTYPGLLEAGIWGNPDQLSGEKLHQTAWELVRPHFRKAQEAAADRFRQHTNSSKALTSLQEVIPAAYQGRVELLFTAVNVQQWGRFDERTQQVHLCSPEERTAAEEDLLDFAAAHTFLYGGSVYAVKQEEMPAVNTSLAALLRGDEQEG